MASATKRHILAGASSPPLAKAQTRSAAEFPILAQLYLVIRSVSRQPQPVVALPYASRRSVRGQQLPEITLAADNDNLQFRPLPAELIDSLHDEHRARHAQAWDAFAAPRSRESLCWWAEPVRDACRLLTAVKKELACEGEPLGRIDCAEFSDNTLYPISRCQGLLLQGEQDPPTALRPVWYVRAFIRSPSPRPGCILVTHRPDHLGDNVVFRSELLAVLMMLESAIFDAFLHRASLRSASTLVLSFAQSRVRAIEARVESSSNIALRIRDITVGIPADMPSSEEAFAELVGWLMNVDPALAQRSVSGLSADSATSGSVLSDGLVDGHMTGNTSFVEDKETKEEVMK